MPGLVVPHEGEVLLLSFAVNKIPSANLKLHLYTNNLDPGENTVLASLTEALATGYAEKVLPSTDWTVSTVGEVTTASHLITTFTFEKASTDYGYFVTNGIGTKIAWLERFSDAPHVIPSGGGTEKITAKLIGD